jgi:hypothetical protein
MSTHLRSLAYSVVPGSPLTLYFSHGGKPYRMPIRVRASGLVLVAPADPTDPNGLPNVQAKIEMDAPVEEAPEFFRAYEPFEQTESEQRALWSKLFCGGNAWIEDPAERTEYLLKEIAALTHDTGCAGVHQRCVSRRMAGSSFCGECMELMKSNPAEVARREASRKTAL